MHDAAPAGTTPAAALAGLRAAEARDGTLSLDRRRDLLAALAALVVREAEALAAAVDADFGGRCLEETFIADLKPVLEAARIARRHLPRWMRPRRAGVPFPFQPARAASEPVPKGIIGIMAPWNYPVQLLLLPAVDALAAGNRLALKPSEAVPRLGALLAELLPAALGADVVQVVLGGPEVAADFAAQPWDHLVFTGGTATGRRVMRAAADNLVPLTLELGGKCPALVLPGADLRRTARAILVGKAINAGQTCVAPDTVLLLGHGRDAFLDACRAVGPVRTDTGIVNAAQAARLEALAAGAVLTPLGADGPAPGRALTIAEAPAGHRLHREEIFGPLLALQPVATLAEAIGWIAARPHPLAIYLFGATAAEERAVADATRSGALVHDRCVEYAAFADLPFGGVGDSGFGRRNGEAGFREFSHLRARVRHGRFSLARLMEPPRSARVNALVRRILR